MTFMRTVTLDEFGCIVLPFEARTKLDLHAGRKLDVYYTEDNTIVLQAAKAENNDLCNICHAAEKFIALKDCNICESCAAQITESVRLTNPHIKKYSKPRCVL